MISNKDIRKSIALAEQASARHLDIEMLGFSCPANLLFASQHGINRKTWRVTYLPRPVIVGKLVRSDTSGRSPQSGD